MKTNVDGHEVYYGTGSGKADGSAPAILFLHGAGFDHSVWVMPARYFARHGYRVVAVDLPAHGRSDGAPLTSIDDMAAWACRVCDALEISATTVIGHSMGSLVAMTFAARYPDRVDKLALLGTSAPMPVTNLLLDAARDNHHAAIDMANTWSHSTGGTIGASENPGISNLNSGERWLERVGPGVYHADLSACNGFDPTVLPSIGAATLVIAGTDDKMTPARAGLSFAEHLPGAETCLLQGSGHAMLSEQPNAVLDALAAFVIGKEAPYG
jgi:pimeloyl-ACP methyl ester carboxylesterase